MKLLERERQQPVESDKWTYMQKSKSEEWESRTEKYMKKEEDKKREIIL